MRSSTCEIAFRAAVGRQGDGADPIRRKLGVDQGGAGCQGHRATAVAGLRRHKGGAVSPELRQHPGAASARRAFFLEQEEGRGLAGGQPVAAKITGDRPARRPVAVAGEKSRATKGRQALPRKLVHAAGEKRVGAAVADEIDGVADRLRARGKPPPKRLR